jgi:O-antigen/teichoic acid export membrane protein
LEGTVLNLIAVVCNQGSTLIANIAVARILMKHGFGEYAIVQGTLLTMATLSQLSTGYTASKYVAEYRSTCPDRAGRIMGLCSIVTAIMATIGMVMLIVISPWISGVMLKAPQLNRALMLGSGFLFFSTVNGYQIGALSGLEAYGSLARAGIVSGIASIISVVFGVWFGGLNGACIGLSVGAFIRCLIHNRLLRCESIMQGIIPQYRGSLSLEKKAITNFALPATITGYYTLPMIWLASSFLVRQPNGYGEMALYSAANNLRILVMFVPSVINSVGLSVLNNEKANGDPLRYDKVFKSNVAYISLVSFVGVLVMAVCGRPMLHVFGKDFVGGYQTLSMLLCAAFLEGVCIALYQYVQSQAKIWHSLFAINMPREGFFVIAAYFLVQSHGAYGLAMAYLGATILGLVAHLLLVIALYVRVGRRGELAFDSGVIPG